MKVPPMSKIQTLRSFALFAALVLSSGLARADERKPIKLATLAPKGSSFHKALLTMGEAWKKGPEGGIALTVYPDGTMGGEADMVRRMRAGQLQAGMLTVSGLSEIDKSVAAFQNLPLVFHSLEEAAWVREKLRANVEKRFEEKGFTVLFWGDVGWVHFFSKTPIVHPDDLKKVKLFTWSGATAQVDLMKSLGLSPVPLETADILISLHSGLLDAVPSVPFYALAGQLYTIANHMLDLNWAPLVGATVVTKKAWDGLPPALRDSMSAAARKAGEEIAAHNKLENDQAVEAMKARGLVVHPVTPELEAEWQKFVEGVYPKLRGLEIPVDLFDAVMQAIEEYRHRGSAPK